MKAEKAVALRVLEGGPRGIGGVAEGLLRRHTTGCGWRTGAVELIGRCRRRVRTSWRCFRCACKIGRRRRR